MGNDQIEGLAGDDHLVGGEGADTLSGDRGVNVLSGGGDDFKIDVLVFVDRETRKPTRREAP